MRKTLIMVSTSFLFLSFIFLFGIKNSVSLQEGYFSQDEYVPNEVLVKFKKGVLRNLAQKAINFVQGKIITHLGAEIITSKWDPEISSIRSFLLDPDLLHIKVPEAIGTERAISLLSSIPYVEYAEKNVIFHMFREPNDDHFTKLWGLHNTGQTDGTVDADIDAPEAWDIFTGSSDVVVAVIDTGIDYNHIDLQANIWTNPGETGGGKETDGIDNDGNGYIDDWRGWNFVNNTNDPMDDNYVYETYHGTHVSGIIGAVGNNDEGVVGVNWNVKLMAVKVLKYDGSGDAAKIVKGIDYATINNAHISNNSYGGDTYHISVSRAITRALNEGKLFVAAAGNYPQLPWRDNDQDPVYPASYSHKNIIAVLSTDHFDNLAWHSHYGRTSVDVGAPGGSKYSEPEKIYSTMRYDDYQYLYGTSMATPHIAGVAALAWGKCYPLTYSQIKERIIDKVDKLSSLNDKCISEGRVNAYSVIYDPFPAGPQPSGLTCQPTGWDLIDLRWQDNSCNEIGFEIQRKKNEPNFSYNHSADSDVTYTQDKTATSGTTFTYRVRAYNMAGYSIFTEEESATVPRGKPNTPYSLYANYLGGGTVQLTWIDGSNNEQEFRIERKSEWEPWWQEIDIVGPNVTIYYDQYYLEPDTFYYYRVRAYNPDGYSSYSNIAHVYIPWH